MTEPESDLELQIVGAILGVPCTPENARQLRTVLAERARCGLRPFSGVGVEPQDDGAAARGRYQLSGTTADEGQLLRATDLALRRDVFLRLISAGQREEQLAAVRLHARLGHPNVQVLHDLGITARGPWADHLGKRMEGDPEIVFAVEQERGVARSLAQLIDSEQSAAERVELLAYLRDVADAVAFAHEQGIVRGGLRAEDITVGLFGEVTLWDWSGVSLVDPASETGCDARLGADLQGLASLITRAGTGADFALAPDLERAVAQAKVGEGSAAELALALAIHLERASEVALDRRAAQNELDLGNEAWARMFPTNQRVERLSRRVEELAPLAGDAGLDSHGFEEHARAREAYREALIAAATARSDALRHFRAAVRHDPGLAQARDSLARLHWEHMEEAASWNDHPGQEFHRRALERYDDGSRVRWLNDPRALAVESEPPGATVRLYRYEPAFGGRILQEQLFRDLGSTPTRQASVPQGSYLLVLRCEGFPDTRYPILVRHGLDGEVKVKLRTAEEIGEGMIYVPAGPFLTGGDPLRRQIGPLRREHLGAFCIGRTHVRCAEYLRFLNELAKVDPDQAERRQPRAGFGASNYWEPAPGGGYRIPERSKDPLRPWAPDLPVLGMDFDDAQAFLQWDSRRRGYSLDLPPELAWEKAVRGADGRFFPWGDYFDSTLCNAAIPSRGLMPVGAMKSDSSPYGVLDAAGNAQEWLRRTAPMTSRELSVVRGGSFYTASFLARATDCRPMDRRIPGDMHGFRRFRWLDPEN